MPNKPWEDEPDKLSGHFCGLEWRIARITDKTLCGYVKLPLGHELYDVPYGDDKLDHIEVHGGLTFGEIDLKDNRMEYGFDCNHIGDLSPGMVEILKAQPSENVTALLTWMETDIYRDMAYVKNQCQRMCWQFTGNTFTSELNEALFEKYAKDE